MLSSLLRSIPRFGRAWKPLSFTNPNFSRIPEGHKVEEERLPNYVASRYYPMRIGDLISNRYQVVGKLGYGATSTAWLARDLERRRHVTLKLFIKSSSMGEQLDDELNMYKRLEKGSKRHPGYNAVRYLLDSFDVTGPEGQHRCLVHVPLWDSTYTLLKRNPVERLPIPIMAVILQYLFLALDFLHTECQIIHTDIRADNIMFSMTDESVFADFEQGELEAPCPRKDIDGRTIYQSRQLKLSKGLGVPILCDFGSAVDGSKEHSECVQPPVYRAPEVILNAPWTYSADIWNAGCMVWDLFEGGSLFYGHDPEFDTYTYRRRVHLAEMVSLLGPPPQSLLARCEDGHEFFSDKGEFCAGMPLRDPVPLEKRETTLEGDAEDKLLFLELMRKMLQWEPERRSSAADLLEDAWMKKHGM